MAPIQNEELTGAVVQRVLTDFGANLKVIGAVELVEATRNGDVLEIQTVVNQPSDDEEEAVYAAEQDIYKRYPAINLDFRLLDRNNQRLGSQDAQESKYLLLLNLPNDSGQAHAVAHV